MRHTNFSVVQVLVNEGAYSLVAVGEEHGSGVGTLAVGHIHPRVSDEVKKEARRRH